MPSSACPGTPVPVAFATSEQYAPYLAVAAHSLLLKASPDRRYEIIVLHEGLGDEVRERIGHAIAPFPNASVRFAEATPEVRDTIGRFDASSYGWPTLVFYRLFLDRLFPEYDRIIFLGVDILVQHDIAELFDTPLGEAPLAAAPDAAAPANSLWQNSLSALGFTAPENYFNSDVQLQNLDAWRCERIGERAFEMLLGYRLPLFEQDALNLLLEKRWVRLGMEWNFQLPQFRHFCPEEYARLPEADRAAAEAILRNRAWNIIHYPGAKPWVLTEGAPAPLADLWWQTALQTPGFSDHFTESLQQQLAGLEAAMRRQRLRRLFASPTVRRRRTEKILGIEESRVFYRALLRQHASPRA